MGDLDTELFMDAKDQVYDLKE